MHQPFSDVVSLPSDSGIEFVEDPKIAIMRLNKIKSALSNLTAQYTPVTAYIALLDTAANNIGLSKMFYFPLPWEVDSGLPSHPSLIADAGHFCRNHDLDSTVGLIVDSFAEWRVLQQQDILCCCRKGSAFAKARMVSIEIVIHHSIGIDRESKSMKIKQMVGIRSSDRDHIENHYDLHRDSRVDDNISIIGSCSVTINTDDLKIVASEEEFAKQLDVVYFRKILTKLCKK